MRKLTFPTLSDQRRVTWSPLLLRPFLDTPERLVIAVACADKQGTHIASADHLMKLKCLFGERADMMIEAADLTIKSAARQMSEHGANFFRTFEPPTSAAMLGEVREDAGTSVEEVAEFWLRATSSLHFQHGSHLTLRVASSLALTPQVRRYDKGEIIRQVMQANPKLVENFQPSFKGGLSSRAMPQVDYASNRLVANIEYIAPNFRAPKIDRIVKRMWDLEISRGGLRSGAERFEMLVQIPERGRDHMTDDQSNRLKETLEQLEQQADQQEIRFRPLTNSAQIGRSILQAEGLVPA